MRTALWGALLASTLGFLPGAAPAAPLVPDDVVAAALAAHPEAVRALATVQIAAADRRAASVFLDNPVVAFGGSVIGGLVQGSLSQPIGLAGEGWHVRQAAAAETGAAGHDADRVRLELAAWTRVAYARAVTRTARLRVAEEAVRQASRLREALVARQAQGEAPALHVALARAAESEAVADAIVAAREQAEALTTLAAFDPRVLGAALADDPADVVPEAGPSGLRADVDAARGRVVAAEAALAAARAAVAPRVDVGVFFQVDRAHGEPGDLGLQASLALPVWARNQGGIARARAALDVARGELSVLRARVDAEQATLPQVAEAA
ncbi:MAG: TolC family protein [Alphaproteobacteria bacterium]|nr:TolC family protein [Alphaproteobacteria bacterium]